MLLCAILVTLTSGCGSSVATAPPPEELRDATVAKLNSLSSATFIIAHEEGQSTNLGMGLLLSSAEGQADFPSRASLEAQARVGRVVVTVGIVQIDGTTYFRGPLGADWQIVDPESLPFDFVGMNRSVADALASADGLSVAVGEEVGGESTFELTGTITSDSLRGLVPSAADGLPLTLTIWVSQADHTPVRVRMVGRVITEDPADMTRFLDLTTVDEDVTIEPPL